MYYKEQRYEKAKASTFASTHKVELPESGILDSILMYLRVKNAADVSGVAPSDLLAHITKVEVIGDTDKTLFSMRGQCAMAKAFRKIGALPAFKQNEYNSKYQDYLLPILFGRKFKDGLYALDLSKWDKVELQVTNDATTSYFASGELNMETRLVTIEDSAATYAKFLKQWEYDATKPDAAGDYVRPKLPTTGRLRALMIQLDPDVSATTGAPTADPLGDSYNWKMWFKDRSLTIYDHRPRDLMRDEHQRLGIGHSHVKMYPSTTKKADLHWGEVIGTTITQLEASADQVQPSIGDSRDRFQALGYAGVGNVVSVNILGCGLFHTFEIPFYLPEDVESAYLDLDRFKPIELEWYGYNYYNTHRVILEKPIGQGPGEYA